MFQAANDPVELLFFLLKLRSRQMSRSISNEKPNEKSVRSFQRFFPLYCQCTEGFAQRKLFGLFSSLVRIPFSEFEYIFHSWLWFWDYSTRKMSFTMLRSRTTISEVCVSGVISSRVGSEVPDVLILLRLEVLIKNQDLSIDVEEK